MDIDPGGAVLGDGAGRRLLQCLLRKKEPLGLRELPRGLAAQPHQGHQRACFFWRVVAAQRGDLCRQLRLVNAFLRQCSRRLPPPG